MAENNSSAPLETARFPGEGGHSWTLSLNQLRGLIAELQNQLDSYEEDPDLEVQLVLSFVHPGLVKDEEDGTTNNVPLLTLHDAEYPEEGVYPINPLDCHAGVTIPPQAVAAQAAPAAVAVTDAQIDAILDEPAGMIFYVSDQRHKQHLFARRVLALAAPVLPATEDSSAGDLAAVQAEPVATNAQEVQWRNIKKVVNALADFCFGSADDPRWGRAHIAIRTSLTAKDGLDILSLGLESLYTAPQAQPADALDAALIGDCLPMQPVIVSPDTGVYRFKENRIVTKLLSHSELTGYSLNEIARDFNQGMYSADEQMQLAQLIGYSVDGYGTLSYVTDESYQRAAAMAAAQEGGIAAEYTQAALDVLADLTGKDGAA